MNACSIEEEWLANHKARSISTKVQVQPSPEDNPIKERISKVLIDLEETVKDIPDKYDPSLVKKEEKSVRKLRPIRKTKRTRKTIKEEIEIKISKTTIVNDDNDKENVASQTNIIKRRDTNKINKKKKCKNAKETKEEEKITTTSKRERKAFRKAIDVNPVSYKS